MVLSPSAGAGGGAVTVDASRVAASSWGSHIWRTLKAAPRTPTVATIPIPTTIQRRADEALWIANLGTGRSTAAGSGKGRAASSVAGCAAAAAGGADPGTGAATGPVR